MSIFSRAFNSLLAWSSNGRMLTGQIGAQYSGEKSPGELARMVSYSYDPNHWNALHFDQLARYCATLYYTSELGRASVNNPLNYIIGPGLKFRSALSAKYLGMEEEEARNFSQELTYKIDELKEDLGYYSLSREVARECMITGDAFIHILRDGSGFIRALTATPGVITVDNTYHDVDRRVANGVWVDRNYSPYAYLSKDTGRRVAFQGRDGVRHIFVRRLERPQQVRGTGIFYFAISRIKNFDRIWEATMEKMIMESVIVGYSDSDGEVQESFLEREKKKQRKSGGVSNSRPTGTSVGLEPGLFMDLQNRTNMKFLPPGTPSGNFGTANEWVFNLIGAGCGYPAEFLLGKYSTSYTAHKGALNDVERHAMVDRAMFIEQMEKPINQLLLQELIARGEISLPRGGVPLRRWLRGHWTHPRIGHINPFPEARAKEISVAQGWQKPSDVAQDYGIDFMDNIAEGAAQLNAWRDLTSSNPTPPTPSSESDTIEGDGGSDNMEVESEN